ncbi:MAG TPA: tetratricopeptide repeat protein, partial [Verrucomicrobiae bacterium]|nr:tetratricopeptide repeat protein [Verrucomicrobiae bacterium]
ALFHAANVALLFLLLMEMTGALWPAAFVAALFAWHPLHVESVAWISERKDVLSTFFGLLALRSYFRYARENSQRSYWLAVLFFACSLMSKPMLVTLPFVFLLLDYWPLGRFAGGPSGNIPCKPIQFSHLAAEKLPFFLLIVPACIVTVWAQSRAAIISLVHLPLGLRVENAIVSYGRYLFKAVWPTHLAIFYPLRTQWPWFEVLVSAFVLVAISWFVWRRKRENPYLLVGWLWYLGTLVPVIGLVQVGTQAMADRYTYLPLVGIFIALAFGAKELIRRFQLGIVPPAVAAGLILAGCLAVTEVQLSYWRDSKSLFAHAVAVTKDNVVAQINLGGVLEQEGNYDAALTHYLKAKEISPNRADVHNNLGNLYADMGKTNEALAEYTQAVQLD